jgi:hypothetical protein
MVARYIAVSSLLRCVRDATKRHKSNPYQIAKATGVRLHSVQKLLKQTSNPTLRNIEVILAGYGIVLFMQEGGPRTIQSGLRRSKQRKRATNVPQARTSKPA